MESVFLRQGSYMSELLLRQQMGILFVYGHSSSYGTRLYWFCLLDIPLYSPATILTVPRIAGLILGYRLSGFVGKTVNVMHFLLNC